MLRTCAVRLFAIELTLSVRSFHTPPTPSTLRLAAELAVGADLARHARHLRRETRRAAGSSVLTIVAERRELALERAPVDVEPHGLQQVAPAPRPRSRASPRW